MLVTEYVDGLRTDEIERLDDAERDRIGEIAFRFYFGLAWRDGIVAGDPHADNCILCPDGRLCLLDFGLLRDLDADYRQGERDDHAGARRRRCAARPRRPVEPRLPARTRTRSTAPRCSSTSRPPASGCSRRGVRRIDPEYVARVLELGYPPRSPYFALMRRMRMPPPTLLLRRMELQVLALLGDFRAGADWGAIAAEHHSGTPASTPLGREDHAFHVRRTRR